MYVEVETHVVSMCSQQPSTGVFNGTSFDVIPPEASAFYGLL